MPPRARKLGLNPSDPEKLARIIRLPLSRAWLAGPPSADHLSNVAKWMLGANDKFGTCGPTSVANHAVMTWKYLLGQDITVTDDAIFDLYRRSGNPGFVPDPDNPVQDNGVDMATMLDALVKGGITITHPDGTAELVKPLAYAALSTPSPASVDPATAIFGGLLFALDLKVAQQKQAGLWDYVPGSAEWGGHATMGGAYTGQHGPHEADEKLVTWAEVMSTTDDFMAHQLDQAFVLLWPAIVAHPAFTEGVDLPTLAADYQAATGRPFPAQPTPPVPDPVPPDAADAALAAATLVWAGQRHVGANKKAALAVQAWLRTKGFTG